METLFQELLDKGLVEFARVSPNFSVALAGSIPYWLDWWEIGQYLNDKWRWQ